MPEEYVDMPTNDKECIICQSPRSSHQEEDGQIFKVQGKYIYICPDHCDAFTIGMGIGRTELNGQVVQALCNLNDSATGWDLKQTVYDIIPLAKRQIQEHKRLKSVPVYSPREIFENLDKHVVGQKDAKTRVSLSVFEHVKQLRDLDNNISPDKHNVLLLGPSGSGKTLIAHTIAKYLELPFASSDSTSFSPTGFQGADVDTAISDLFFKAKGIAQTAEKGFVFFDEFDKLGTYQNGGNGSKTDMLNLSTQNSLLRLIEGKKVRVPINNMGGEAQVSTEKILFFFGGAFTGLVDIVGKLKGLSERQIGFQSQRSNQSLEEAKKTYDILCNTSLDVMTQALIEYGFSPELIGRIPVVVPLAPLTKEQLYDFLTLMDHSPLLRQKHLFAESGYEINFTEEYVDSLIEKVYKMATGTRALTNAVKTSTSCAAFNLLTGPTGKNHGSIIIDSECLDNPESYVHIPRNQKTKTQKNVIVI